MKNPLAGWRQAWEQRVYRWADQRAPRARSMQLHRKNLYTFPNSTGVVFLMLVMVIWLLGTNYQNNLILAVSYLLTSLFVVSILHAYANLAGMRIKFITARPAFAGEPVAFVLELSCSQRSGCDNLELRWPGGETQVVMLNYGEPLQVTVWANSEKRGPFRPGRLLVQSCFPLGIIRCWTWLNLDAEALVYPAPIACDEPRAQASNGNQEGGSWRSGGDDFSGLHEYRPGDPIKHIAWKHYAKGKGLHTKEYQQLLSAEKWLHWDGLNHPQELRLSGLCYWALTYEQQHISYGLHLPGLLLEPAHGDAHRQQVLSALAGFKLPHEVTHAS